MSRVKTHFLQSENWEEFQQALGKKTIRVDGHLGIVERKKFINKIYFPYLNIKNSELKRFTGNVIRKHKSVSLIVADFIDTSPKELEKNRWHKTKAVQPHDTIINNVSISQEEILVAVSKTNRKAYQKNIDGGVEFTVSYNTKDVDNLLRLLQTVESRKNIKIHDENYFKTMANTLFKSRSAGLMLASFHRKIIAARIFLRSKNTLMSINVGVDDEYRKQRVGAALNVATLLFAHREGLELVDWWGAAPEDASKSHAWTGFTEYKLSFGGERLHYSGTWELPIKRGRYMLYKIVKKLLRKP